MKKFIVPSLVSIFFITLLACTNLSSAEPASVNTANQAIGNKDTIITKVIKAYGGEKLSSLRSFRIEDKNMETYPGQGFTPDYTDFWDTRSIIQLDLINQRGDFETWGDQYGRILHFRGITTQDSATSIDYWNQTFENVSEFTFYQRHGGNIRFSDTLLAYELAKATNKSEYLGTVNYRGMPHHHIQLEMPESPPLSLYVGMQDFMIKRMHRILPTLEVFYLFDNHAQKNGISFAKDFRFFYDSDFILSTVKREIFVNKLTNDAFTTDNAVKVAPEAFDNSEAIVNKLSDNAYHLGTENFSAFVDAGDHIIGIGGYGGLKDRFEAYQKEVSNNKPLRYQVVTHHHTDHMEGLSEAYALGATLVMSENIVDNVKDVVDGLSDERIITYENQDTFGPIELHEVSTSHSEFNTVTYIPEAKALFQADHYGGFLANGPSPATRSSYSLKQELDKLNLDIEKILSVHSGKVETWSDYASSMSQYDPNPCRLNRPICAN